MLKTFNIILFSYPFCLATGEECCPMQAAATPELLLQAAPTAYTKYFLHHSGNKKFWVKLGDTEHLQT